MVTEQELINQAIEASKKAYAPYSNFHVGAALLTASGKVFQGCNVENVSFGATNCAERTAIFSAVVNGEREFKKLVIYVDREEFTPPCGICRQVISEFSHDLEILLANNKGEVKRTNIKEVLPLSFDFEMK
ncbi:MAG: cytidine deaminase [Candidatus Riflebacteria bacterium]|jgi:cytidine deaminase|nr:cytidine deaminase [Candidatus Riflebacteria bacterium]